MGYQALLFCSDEKLLKVVGQVFGTWTLRRARARAVRSRQKADGRNITTRSWSTARTNRTLPCCSRAQGIPPPITALCHRIMEGKRSRPRPTALAPTLCSPNRSTSSKARERFGWREDSCEKLGGRRRDQNGRAHNTREFDSYVRGSSSSQPEERSRDGSSLRRSEAPDSKTPLPAITLEGQPARLQGLFCNERAEGNRRPDDGYSDGRYAGT